MSEELERMTVGDLKKLLADEPDDLLVILQKDSEGNGYSPCDGGERARYVAETTWMGEVPHPDDDDGSGEPCFVLWPVN